jgi:hypothetical protein
MTTEFSATAADTAILQLAEEPSIAAHPAKALFDRAVEAILPAVRSFALVKNVPIDDHEQLGMARYSAHTVGPSTLQGIMTLEPDAIRRIQASINNSLDILCLARYADHVLVASGCRQFDEKLPIAWAMQQLTESFANDRGPSIRKWPDMEDMVQGYFQFAAASDAQAQTLTLPEDALRRVLVRLPVNLTRGTATEVADGR